MHSLGQSLKSDPFVECDREGYASYPLIIDTGEIQRGVQAHNATGPLDPDALVNNRMDYT